MTTDPQNRENGASADLRFTLCPECLGKYRSLRFDPKAQLWLATTAASMYWKDEHPSGELPPPSFAYRHAKELQAHMECGDSLRGLLNARTMLWRRGSIPEQWQAFWAQAQQALPEWPGFKRLILDEEQRLSLEHAGAEHEEIMEWFSKQSSQVVVHHRPDGVTDTVFKLAVPETAGAVGSVRNLKTPWWQFWKPRGRR